MVRRQLGSGEYFASSGRERTLQSTDYESIALPPN